MCCCVAVCGKQVEGILSVSDETCLLEVLQAEGALEQGNGVVNTKAQSAKLKNALREAGVSFCCRGSRASGIRLVTVRVRAGDVRKCHPAEQTPHDEALEGRPKCLLKARSPAEGQRCVYLKVIRYRSVGHL